MTSTKPEQSNEELCRLISRGSRDSQNTLILQNKPYIYKLAHHIVKKYGGAYLIEDLIQVGYIELLRCAKEFDFERDTTLLTYAHKGIVGAMLREFERMSESYGIPTRKMKQLRKVIAVLGKYAHLPEAEQTMQAADELGITQERVDALLHEAATLQTVPLADCTGLSQPCFIGAALDMYRLPIEEYCLNKMLFQTAMAKIQEVLTAKQFEVVSMYCGLNQHREHSFKEIAELFCLKEAAVKKIHDKALDDLQHAPGGYRLFNVW